MWSLLVAVLTVVITVAVARSGWKRDKAQRDDALLGTCAAAMCKLLQARYEPLAGREWTPFDGAAANEHHTNAIAAMNSVSSERRNHELVRFLAVQSVAIQEESIRYRKSREHVDDIDANRVGFRRGAIFDAATMMQEDIMIWQRTGSCDHVRSFWSHYAAHLISKSRAG